MSGIGSVLRFQLRRERVRIPVTVVLLTLVVASTAMQSGTLYATQAERDAYAASVAGNPGMVALVGPTHAVDRSAATWPGRWAASGPSPWRS